MSRIGRTPVTIPEKVEVMFDGQNVTVKGPRGELHTRLPDCVVATPEDNRVMLTCDGYERNPKERALYGTARANLNNCVIGVSEGFKRNLEIHGVGYRGQASGQKLTLNVGYSNPVEYEAPEGVSVTMPQNTQIVVEGNNKETVGQVAAVIRGFRSPDSYKGKGIRYEGEQVKLKEGKSIG